MADHTHIEWTDATWNPITGCTLVSEGCTHCYAARLAATRLKHHPSRKGLARLNAAGDAKFTGEVRFNRQWLDEPLRWKRPRMIFVCAHGDLFHPDVPDDWIDQVFAVMALAPQHTFQVLTKRPERMREYMLERWQPAPARSIPVGDVTFDFDAETKGEDRRDQVVRAAEEMIDTDKVLKRRFADLDNPLHWDANENLKATAFAWPLPNVWLGTSVEDQRRADERIPHLLATPAAVRFVSAEPLLGAIDLLPYLFIYTHADDVVLSAPGEASLPFNDPAATDPSTIATPRIDWVIAGGESGPGSRPMHPDWARSLRDQCNDAGVAFFFKQWGAFLPTETDIDSFYRPDFERLGEKVIEADGVFSQKPFGQVFEVAGHVGKKAAGRLLDGIEHNGMPNHG